MSLKPQEATKPLIGQRVFVPVPVDGVEIPLNIKWYYRIHCHEHGCKKQRDGGYHTPLPRFVKMALAEGWRYTEEGNFLCPTHTTVKGTS